MPKKTKRKKILAEYRRKLSALTPSVRESPPKTSDINTPSLSDQSVFTFQKKETTNITAVKTEVREEYKTIRKDLIKTLILASIMICIELAVYWKIG